MKVTTFAKKLTDVERGLFEEYLATKIGKIEKLIQEFDEDAVVLKVSIEKFANKNAYKVEMCLDLPKATPKALYSSEDSHEIRTAIDSSKDKLIDQIKRAMEKLHHLHERAT